MRSIVNALLLRDGCVLLGRRSPARRTYPGLWSFPGGHVEPGESLDDALRREVREEIGVVPSVFRSLGVIEEPDPQANGPARYHIHAVTGWDGGDPTMLGDEHSEIRWFSLMAAERLRDLALAEYRHLFRRLASGQA